MLDSWKDLTIKFKAGFGASLLVLGFAVWTFSDNWVLTHAEAAAMHKGLVAGRLVELRYRIDDTNTKKVETKYRKDMGQQVKDELIAGYDSELIRLRKSVDCYKEGKLTCE